MLRRKIDNLGIQKVWRITQERAQLHNHRYVKFAWEVEGIDDRDHICQVKVALVHLGQQKWDGQGKNERDFEEYGWRELLLAYQHQKTAEDDEPYRQQDTNPFPLTPRPR